MFFSFLYFKGRPEKHKSPFKLAQALSHDHFSPIQKKRGYQFLNCLDYNVKLKYPAFMLCTLNPAFLFPPGRCKVPSLFSLFFFLSLRVRLCFLLLIYNVAFVPKIYYRHRLSFVNYLHSQIISRIFFLVIHVLWLLDVHFKGASTTSTVLLTSTQIEAKNICLDLWSLCWRFHFNRFARPKLYFFYVPSRLKCYDL